MEDIKSITNEEMMQLESFQKEQKIQKLEKKLLEQEAVIIQHQQEQLKMKASLMDLELLKTKLRIDQRNERLQSLMNKAKEFHATLEEKYELKPGWGYNPDSLAIIQKED